MLFVFYSMSSIGIGGLGGLSGLGGLGGIGGLGGFGGLGSLGGLGGSGGGAGPICGIPIGFGVTTTVSGLNPYPDDFYGGIAPYQPEFEFGPPGFGGPTMGGFPNAVNRGYYGRRF